MAMVVIRCPETSHAVLTGIEVDSGLQGLADVAYETDCPLCGNTHVWWKGSAWVSASPHHPEDAAAVSQVYRQEPLTSAGPEAH